MNYEELPLYPSDMSSEKTVRRYSLSNKSLMRIQRLNNIFKLALIGRLLVGYPQRPSGLLKKKIYGADNSRSLNGKDPVPCFDQKKRWCRHKLSV